MPLGGDDGAVEDLCPRWRLASVPEDLRWFCSGCVSADESLGLVLMGRTRLTVWCSDWVRTRTGLGLLVLSAADLQPRSFLLERLDGCAEAAPVFSLVTGVLAPPPSFVDWSPTVPLL